MTRGLFSNLARTVSLCGLLFLAGTGSSFAGTSVPELDPGSAVGGIALAIGPRCCSRSATVAAD